jgi:hypothetical protein
VLDPVAFEKVPATSGAVMPVVNSDRIAAQKLALLHKDAEIRRRTQDGFKTMLEFGGHFRGQVHLGICRGERIPRTATDEMDRTGDDVFRE